MGRVLLSRSSSTRSTSRHPRIEDGTIAWSTLYNNHIKEINADPIDLLEPAVDNTENEMADEEEELFEDDNEQDKFWPNWMLLAEMDPKSSFNCSSDLG